MAVGLDGDQHAQRTVIVTVLGGLWVIEGARAFNLAAPQTM